MCLLAPTRKSALSFFLLDGIDVQPTVAANHSQFALWLSSSGYLSDRFRPDPNESGVYTTSRHKKVSKFGIEMVDLRLLRTASVNRRKRDLPYSYMFAKHKNIFPTDEQGACTGTRIHSLSNSLCFFSSLCLQCITVLGRVRVWRGRGSVSNTCTSKVL